MSWGLFYLWPFFDLDFTHCVVWSLRGATSRKKQTSVHRLLNGKRRLVICRTEACCIRETSCMTVCVSWRGSWRCPKVIFEDYELENKNDVFHPDLVSRSSSLLEARAEATSKSALWEIFLPLQGTIFSGLNSSFENVLCDCEHYTSALQCETL